MAGIWNSQNKIIPGAYFNFRTNTPLSITVGDRGTVVLLQDMNEGTLGEIYTVTATENDYPQNIKQEDRLLASEALKGAKTVKVYNLGIEHDSEDLESALEVLKTKDFNTICYPYNNEMNKSTIKNWVKTMRDEEGKKIQAVLANYKADYEAIINVTQGIVLTDGTKLTPEQTTAWVAGQTAGSNISKSNTGQVYIGAIDVAPRMTKIAMEQAIQDGEFIFKVDNTQNVTAVYDINSLTTITTNKGKEFTKNRIIRTIDGINNDVAEIFESNYIGKIDNNEDGRSILRATLIEYFNELQRMDAIQNFTTEDVRVSSGQDKDAVIIDCYIQPVDAAEKIYVTVNLL